MREYNEVTSIEKNQLIRIGVLIVDIKRDLPLPIDEEEIRFIEVEFIQIASDMLDIWTAREIGLVYYMQFHLAEAQRLLKEINKEIGNAAARIEAAELVVFRKLLYETIKWGLKGLIKTLNSLESGEGIRLDVM